MSRFPKKFEHTFEESIYKFWLDNNCFLPNGDKKAKTFVVPVPPPNVTGVLHLGHAFTLAIQDIFTRYYRMNGYNTLRIPGTDHAGISTQAKVEEKLAKEKKLTKYDLGREQFLQEMRTWVHQHRKIITSQVKAMGSSVDRSREEFTMSEHQCRAVRKAFTNLYKQKKVYQDKYIVNRSVGCQTVISDIEVNHVPNKGKIYYINYFIEGKADYITIATTRPETMFADVAVAVNPYDKRYKKFIGKNVLIPILNKPIPVIADEAVDMTFGSGALKITPTHDLLDFEIAKRNNLSMNIFAIDKKGMFTEHAGELFVGKDVEQFLPNIIQHLRDIGNLEREEEYENTVPYCQRSGTRIQPMLSKQRFLDVKDSAAKSLEMMKSEEVKVYPSRFIETFEQWLGNIRPRCISRQLRRGHRMPLRKGKSGEFHAIDEDLILEKYIADKSKGNVILSMIIFNLIADSRLKNRFNIEELVEILLQPSLIPNRGFIGNAYCIEYKHKFASDKALLKQVSEFESFIKSMDLDGKKMISQAEVIVDILEEAYAIKQDGDVYVLDFDGLSGDKELEQEEDVFDTWFSSALRPFSILGRPDKTPDFEQYYPMTLLETGYDIIFFWIARMMIMGIEQTGVAPFKNVYLHGIIKDEKGQKMSKSKGNGIDPIEMIDQYGTDSLRMCLVSGTTPGNDSNFSPSKADYFHRFYNKLWNASRYVYTKMLDEPENPSFNYDEIAKDIEKNISKLSEFDKRILEQMNTLITSTNESITKYHLSDVGNDIAATMRNSFCDRYIELSKIQSSPFTTKVMLYVLGTSFKVLHPFAPFVTEKLRGILGFEGILCTSSRPKGIELPEKNYKINLLMDVITQLRQLRAKTGCKSNEECEVIIQSNMEFLEFVKQYEDLIKTIIKTSSLKFLPEQDLIADDFEVAVLVNVKIALKGIKIIDNKTKLALLEKQLEDEKRFLQDLRTVLANTGFVSNAPKELIDGKKIKYEEVKKKIEMIDLEISKLKMIMK